MAKTNFWNTVMIKKINVLHLNLFFLLFLCSGCVSSSEFQLLESKVAALEEDNTKLKKQYDIIINEDFITLEKEQREKYAEVRDMMESLKNDIQIVRGNLEESEHRLKEASEAAGASELGRLDNAISMNYRRILRIEQHLGLESSEPADGSVVPSQVEQPSDGTAKTSSSSSGTVQSGTSTQNASEDSLYNAAKALLDAGKNEPARNQFEAFIKRYPTSENADNARFWVADSYYREKWYEKAILEYQRVIEEYSKGNKVPSALLKQAYSFANLGEKSNARLILNELIKKYPQTQEAESAKEKLKTLN
ncbi:MAG: tol-pal system protein YbgF [Desulfamplus sp.]|nr:tol-pal system protein YbgF [Desulfamplus sp.]